MSRKWLDMVKGAALFGLLAPPLGALVAFLLIGFSKMFSPQSEEEVLIHIAISLFNMVLNFVLLLLLAYPFGFVPAVLIGVIAGWLRPKIYNLKQCMLMGIAGLLVASVLPTRLLTGEWAIEDLVVLYAPAAFVSCTLCAMMFRLTRGPAPALANAASA